MLPSIIPSASAPAYRIETARLVVRCWDPADAPLLEATVHANLDHLRPSMPWARDEPTPLDARIARLRRMRGMFDLGEDFTFGVFDRDERTVLGATGLHTRVGPRAREIGYWIARDRQGQGLVTEWCAALVRVGFELEGLVRIEIHCAPDNPRSAAVAARLGFRHDATLRARLVRDDGSTRDTMVWSMLASEYPDSPRAGEPIAAYDAAGRRLI